MRRWFLVAAAAVWVSLPALTAQLPGAGPDDEELRKTAPEDPYTERDPQRMAAAGIEGYAPMAWADHLRTDDIERVLGAGRFLWLETAHFRIGSSLRSVPVPDRNSQRKALHDEIDALRARLPKVPKRPRRLDPWLRLHLYAQRAEALYAAFTAQLGLPAGFDGTAPPDGPVLGMGGKFLILLCQKNSDLERYLARFADVTARRSYRHYHSKTHQMLLVIGVDAFEDFDECALHSHFAYSVAANLVAGCRGYFYTVPPWFSEGLAHWFSRSIETDFVNVQAKPGEAVEEMRQHEWPRKVRARAQFERATIPFSTMLDWFDYAELGYQAHIQSWSRIDFLMQRDGRKVGQMLLRLKSLPPPLPDRPLAHETLQQVQRDALRELFGLEPAEFDAQWREWVLKTYPRK